MEMVKELPRRKHEGYMRKWGLFLCPFCGKTVEKDQHHGGKNRSCGCLRWLARKKCMNSVWIKGETALIVTKDKQKIIIDADDVTLTREYYWYVGGNGYVYSQRVGILHKFLTGNAMTDHIDGNRLNNRRSNLRKCTNQQNCMNRGRNKNNTSGYKGVFYRKDRGKWFSQIQVNGSVHRLGNFETKDDAARAYDSAAIKLVGEFAWTNL